MKGAKVGDPASYGNLARLYNNSEYKNLDYKEALKWVLLAQYIDPLINYGDFHNIYDPNESFTNKIKSHLTEIQINEVTKRKEEWLKANPQVIEIYQVRNYKRWLETNRSDISHEFEIFSYPLTKVGDFCILSTADTDVGVEDPTGKIHYEKAENISKNANTQQDFIIAYANYQIALARGMLEAKEKMIDIEKKMTAEAIMFAKGDF